MSYLEELSKLQDKGYAVTIVCWPDGYIQNFLENKQELRIAGCNISIGRILSVGGDTMETTAKKAMNEFKRWEALNEKVKG